MSPSRVRRTYPGVVPSYPTRLPAADSWQRAVGPTTAPPDAFDRLAELVGSGGVLVLSGAGLSTESGIPDYRGPSGSLRRHTPMTYDQFVGAPTARQRYWARSYLGWRTITKAEPNAGHRAVAALQQRGLVGGIITQNVDGLHQAGGARNVVELHGSLDDVICLSCRTRCTRLSHDERLRAANPDFAAEVSRVNPDGDAELADDIVARFRLVPCAGCGSDRLKPDVVFFGENVPRERVEQCYAMVDRAASLLVLGSSLTVMSGFRFVRHASRRGIGIAIVNEGPTRGDDHATVRLHARLGPTLSRLEQVVGGAS
jgi:NAD-dependent SIR2 family protein deacetylase